MTNHSFRQFVFEKLLPGLLTGLLVVAVFLPYHSLHGDIQDVQEQSAGVSRELGANAEQFRSIDQALQTIREDIRQIRDHLITTTQASALTAPQENK